MKRRTGIKVLGAILIWAAIIVLVWLAAAGAVSVVKPGQSAEFGLSRAIKELLIILFVSALAVVALGVLYIAQLFVWLTQGKFILLRYRLLLDVLFCLLSSLGIGLLYGDIGASVPIFLPMALVMALGDVLMSGYVRLVDPEALALPVLPPGPMPERFNIFGDPVPPPRPSGPLPERFNIFGDPVPPPRDHGS